jgi:hypothetical protein
MLKRRNSPYASHDRDAERNVETNFSPQLLAPLPVAPGKFMQKKSNRTVFRLDPEAQY